ncbi:MAG: flagellin [Roseburia sp.]
MNGISSVSSNSYTSYGKFASGSKLQSAADGAAELTIAEQEKTQITGYEVGNRNIQSAKNVLDISDQALGSINDYLQRIRELSLQAMNTATVTDADRENIQKEVEQLKQGMEDVASNTQYNTKNLLDGTNSSFQIATDANGSSKAITTANAKLQALGIADYDVTGNFDLQTLDDAIAKVNENRSSMGAQSNTLDYASGYNSNASYNMTGAESRLEDLDYPKAISDVKKEQLLNEYSLMMQKKQQEEEEKRALNLFM